MRPGAGGSSPAPAEGSGAAGDRPREPAAAAGAYLPIDAYALIGDMRTVALVGHNGSIDWCCFPRFDSSSVFAALLDDARGGRWCIAPRGPYSSAQEYVPGTNILVTRFTTGSGAIELTDFMPSLETGHELSGDHEIHRRVRCTRGTVELEVLFEPRFDYGREATRLRARRDGVHASDSHAEQVALAASEPVRWTVDPRRARATSRTSLRRGDVVWFVLRYAADKPLAVEHYGSDRKLQATRRFWKEWTASIEYEGPYRQQVERSALALKLLFYAPTGAVIAAPTTSLPEEIGGMRNWDYRFTWLRDAAFTLHALQTIGHYGEAGRFAEYLVGIAQRSSGRLQIMYGVGGERSLPERVLDHLEGYAGSRPVRIGNAAHRQIQLDVYGEVIESIHAWYLKHGRLTESVWLLVRRMADRVVRIWKQKDYGIWEVRADIQHYVFSKVMCWLALDRAVRIAERTGHPGDVARWRAEAEQIRAQVLARGWSEERQSFVQHYDTLALDAANLLIPLVGFLPADDPRVRATVHATIEGLTTEDREMVYRYRNPDGLPGDEGVFSICTFWLAMALIGSGEVQAGRQIFQKMLSHANAVGLYSEELDPRTGAFLGNFPQALTHIALIHTAKMLEVAERRGKAAVRQEPPIGGTDS